ncbi:MAG: acylhydrolase [Clostridiales bacterium]|nr:acylhydrolase [Clostridiales bacterium]
MDDVGDVAQPDETVKTGEDTAENRAEERTEGNDRVEDGENLTYEFVPVDEEYFDDALFIGDSRTVGLYEYAGLEERAAFYCKTSLTIWDVLDKPIVKVEGQKKPVTIEEALSQKQFGKIYLMVGINELGRGDVDQFMEQYRKVVERIRQLQPDAIVFVEGIMRVAGEKDASDAIFNNTNINVRNEQIALLADNRDIFYIDVNEAVCDEEGNLRAEYTFDQIHLKAAYYEIWKEFLLQHGIVRTDKNP